MPQQEAHFEEPDQSGSQASSYGYEGTPPPNNYASNFYGLKLAGPVASRMASAGQRLALAIVSLVLLMVMIFGLILIAEAADAPDWAIIPILMIIVLFGVVVTIVNVIFNRSH
jgi:cytochrome bd-type quinol oxidase subunit 2